MYAGRTCGRLEWSRNMAEITAGMIKDLRERTGAGMSDCKKALTEVTGDMEKAVEYLRKKGLASAAKKAGRIAAEGRIFSYVHGNGRIAVIVEVNCETDFVAKTDDFASFGKDVAMQIAAMNPAYVSDDEIPGDAIERERSIRKDQARQGGKPENMLDKIVDGQIAKWKKEICLLDQIFVKDPDGKKDIRTLLNEMIAKIGENCKVRRFMRYEVGEGLEKKKDDFAAEVRAQAGLA
jgi:elongation factor Ts